MQVLVCHMLQVLRYIILFTISIWNIVTGTFVEKAMKLAVPDFESMAFDQAAPRIHVGRCHCPFLSFIISMIPSHVFHF